MTAPIITPPGPLARDGLSVTTLTADQSVTWSATGGVVTPASGLSTDWTAPNRSGVWSVHATNGSSQVTNVAAVVLAVLPNFWTFRTPITAAKNARTFKPISGPSVWRGYGPNLPIYSWELGNDDDEIDHGKEMKALWEWHYGTGGQFALDDPIAVERRIYEFDSDFTYDYTESGGWSWKVRIAEVYPYVVINL